MPQDLLLLHCMLLLHTPCAVDFSVWMGVCPCGCPISISALQAGMASLALRKIAPISASAALDITVLIKFAVLSATPANNGAVLNTANLIKMVMSSAAEAEMETIFLNAREAIPASNALIEMGHNQGQTPIQTDNSTAHGVCNNNMQCKIVRLRTG